MQVRASGVYDAAARRYTLTLEQSCGPSPGQPVKAPFHIPVRRARFSRPMRDSNIYTRLAPD
jgi:hypothetical protein